ncbi:glycoside hydrolase family protein [Phormidium tenue FACHB-886]|nr:glycoside hydrolase family protein [Phormidium tenue FACHB-886]
MSRTAEDSLKQAKAIALNSSGKGWKTESGFNSNQLYSVRLKQRSSFNLQLNGTRSTAELIQDRNRNAQIDPGETIARSRLKRGVNTLKANDLKQGTYFVQVGEAGAYQLAVSTEAKGLDQSSYGSWSAAGDSAGTERSEGYQYLSLGDVLDGIFNGKGKRTSTSRWNGSFINRTSSDVTDYRNYDFSRPALSKDLGGRGKRGKVLAQLKTDFGTRSPGSNVQSDNYAMQAWTRVSLKEGKTYQISSNSNDGTRFFFRDSKSGKVVSSFEGDWRDNGGEWKQSFSVGDNAGGSYDFYVQHYDKSGTSSVNVRLEEAQLMGTVTTSSLNLRSKPSTLNNTPITALDYGTNLTIVRKVESSNDSAVPEWYEVVAPNGRRGYVAAQSDLVKLNGGNVATFGNGSIQGDGGTRPDTNPRPTPGGGGSSNGKTNQSGVDLIKSFEGLRLTAYRDPVGVLTIGYGTTTGVFEGQRISESQAEAFLKKDLERFERAVNNSVKVSLNSNQFAALVSFTYNVGEGALASSTLLQYLNQGNYQGAADQLLRWNKGDGVELAGLTRRRKAERAMFLGQDYTAFL